MDEPCSPTGQALGGHDEAQGFRLSTGEARGGHDGARGRRSRRGGFSLVEVIAAITILSILVLLIGRLFADAQNAMQVGLRSAEVNSNARAVLDFMSRDIQTAIFDDSGTSGVAPYLRLRMLTAPNSITVSRGYLGVNKEGNRGIIFVAPINTPRLQPPPNDKYRRDTKIVAYWIRQPQSNRFELMRGEFYDHEAMHRYNTANWDTGSGLTGAQSAGGVMIQNVRSVLFNYVAERDGGSYSFEVATDSFEVATDTNSARPLAYLDVHLELLSPQDARRAADLFGVPGVNMPSAVAFVERAVRRYHQRIFFYNAHGYYRPDR